MSLQYIIPASVLAVVLSVGCGAQQTAFKSVPVAESADASADAGIAVGSEQPLENASEDSNASDGSPTTVVVGVGDQTDGPVASVMTISMEEGPGTNGVDSGTASGSENPASTDIATSGITGTNETENQSTTVTNSTSAQGTTSGSNGSTGDEVLVGDTLSKKAIKDCTGSSDYPANKIKVVSSKNSGLITIKADEYIVIHVSGNKPVVKINSANAEKEKVKGLCIFVAGNQAKIEAVLGINLGTFSYFGTGNQSSGLVEVGEEVGIDVINVRLRGNQAKLTISGEGQYKCGSADVGGNKGHYSCGVK